MFISCRLEACLGCSSRQKRPVATDSVLFGPLVTSAPSGTMVIAEPVLHSICRGFPFPLMRSGGALLQGSVCCPTQSTIHDIWIGHARHVASRVRIFLQILGAVVFRRCTPLTFPAQDRLRQMLTKVRLACAVREAGRRPHSSATARCHRSEMRDATAQGGSRPSMT